jgi:serine/threonine protein kinase/formylglycine-generating enzyme required for sulfatase activity
MNEREIFQKALDHMDLAQRQAYVAQVCGDDAALRARIEALLTSHASESQFLNVPALEQLQPPALSSDDTATLHIQGGGDAVADETKPDDEIPLGFLQPATRPDSLGRIGHYEVLQVLGQGGFGIVFRAFDEVLHRIVAVKVLSPQMASTSPARKRFIREARSSAKVRHENVVQTYEVEEQPLPYIVMEFIPGETLQQRLDRVGPVDAVEVVRIGRQIAEGLAAAHATDLVHRDIKPGNVLLEGGAQRVKITDFGLARAADDASISQSGIIAGTPMYMAPEQAKGETLDQRADLFSLGSVLYVMVAGRPPFRANGTLAVLKRVAEDNPRPIREIIPETPQWLCDIIAKLHAKKPEDRFQSAREVADVLADCEAQLKANARLKDFSRIPQSKRVAGASGRLKWIAAAVLLLPVLALAVTESAGVTHLFRGQQAKFEPIQREGGPSLLAKDAPPSEAGNWVQLFNGQDLTGWKPHPDKPGDWRVLDKILVGTGAGQLYTIRDDYRNFHLRAEMRISSGADNGIYFRAKLQPPSLPGKARTPSGYVVDIAEGRDVYTGPISFRNPRNDSWTTYGAKSTVKPGEWFTLDLIADGNRLATKVNDVAAVDFVEDLNAYNKGHIALLVWNRDNVNFRKIEIKELPATSLPPAFTNGLGMEFVNVPKGKSWLGGSKDKLGDKEVEIRADFYLGKYEVTQEEWEKVMGSNPSGFKAVPGVPPEDQKRFPVENVSWEDIQSFVKLLNAQMKEADWVYRLPKQTEWEYACRGGPMSDRSASGFDIYCEEPTNQLQPDQANIRGKEGKERTCKVGSYKPNRLGLYDMHGNVWEWCDDLFDPNDPDPLIASLRAIRGGSYVDTTENCRAANRHANTPSLRSPLFGFRLARVPSGVPSPVVKAPPLAVAPLTDAEVKRIAALPVAEQVDEVWRELRRRNPGFEGSGEYVNEDGVVTELRINTDKVTDISPIRVFQGLRVLDCSGSHTPDWKSGTGLLADLTPLKEMKLGELTHLNLAYTKVDDAGMAFFKDCRHLTGLSLTDTKVSDAGLAFFKNCNELKLLALNSTQVSDDGLTAFKDCKDLMHLYLGGTKVSDAGLAQFKDCKNLRHLGLPCKQVTDAGVAHFKDCKELTLLDLGNSQVTDTGLSHFKDCKNLTELWLAGTKVTDLSLLKGMPLKVLGCDFRPARDSEILRSIKTLETINDKPVEEFWKSVEKE